jgi:hypothetical protein
VFLLAYVLIGRFLSNGWIFWLMTAAVALFLPYYTYRAMLRVYGQKRWLTLLKFWTLGLSYIVLISIMAVFLSLYTVVTL